jgi:hypothetical protein
MFVARKLALPLSLFLVGAIGAINGCTTSESDSLPIIPSSGSGGSGTGGATTGSGGSTGSGGTMAGSGGSTGSGGTMAGSGGSTGSGGTMAGSGGAAMDAAKDTGGGDAGGGMLTFAKDVSPILQSKCGGCHGTDGMLSVATLTAVSGATSTANCAKNVSKKRVVPGDPTMSFLYLKVSTPTAMLGANCGNQMPRNGPPFLSTADQTTIKNWIMQGAN